VRYLRHQAPGTRILMLTMGTDPEDVVAGIGAGAVGYLARDAVLPEVAAALAMVPAPESAPPPDRALESVVDLTDRELQVLEGMSRGRSNSEIGNDLFLSEDTIKTHARRLFRKMRVRDRAHAVAEGFRRGLLR
jgi:DNA-binding NarL/FixJ family response regulator